MDVHDLTTWARQIIDPTIAVNGLVAPEAVFRSDLLPAWSDDWVLVDRERLRQLRMHALEALADRLIKAGRYEEASRAASASVEIEPLRESAHRAVIRVHVAERNIGAALRAYETYRVALMNELDLTPSPLTQGMLGQAQAPGHGERCVCDGSATHRRRAGDASGIA